MKWIDRFLGFQGPREKFGFPGQQEGEEVEYLGTQHWVKLLPFLFLFTVAVLMVILFNTTFFVFFVTENPFLIFAVNSICAVVLLHIFALQLFNFFMNVLIITNYRIIDVRYSVYLKRERDTIHLQNVQDIHYRQSGIWQRVFDYGTLDIYGSSVDVEYCIRNVPDVERIHSMLCHIHRSAMVRHETPGALDHHAPADII